MVAQFVGGAKLFEAVTGYSYVIGLVVFGLVVVIYTAVGGFRGVAVTDALCAIAMLVGMFILLVGILKAGGGYEAIMEQITVRRPELLEPLSGGNMPYTLYISQWMLVGIFTVGLPQSVVRCITYKDTKSLHRAIIIGTVVIGAMNIGMNFIGVLSQGILTEDLAAYGNSVDNIMPLAIVRSLSPAGGRYYHHRTDRSVHIHHIVSAFDGDFFYYKGCYMYEKEKRQKKISEKKTSMLSQLCTLVLGLIIFFISINPPDVIWKINMFAFGGLETAFFWVFVLGMFWKKANKTGAIWAMAGGTIVYCVTMLLGIEIMEIHQILIGIVVSLLCMIIGSYVGKGVDKRRWVLIFVNKCSKEKE